MDLIQLEVADFNIFELPELTEYEALMKKYGSGNRQNVFRYFVVI